MDIDLLAKMVKEVIMDHDSVTLPGVGCFVTEVVPASFTDKGYTIHPPYRRLYFSPKQGNDALLAGLYARSNNISEEDATHILVEFLSEMKEVLKVRKTIVFPGLGRLRATRENHFFFVADEDLDIYPAGFGLESISLKTHEETKEEVEAAVSNLADMLEAPAPEPEPGPEPVTEPEPAPEPEPEVVPEPEPEEEVWSTRIDTTWYDDVETVSKFEDGTATWNVFYQIRESDFEADEQLRLIGTFLKEHKDCKIDIKSYADKKTGNPRINMDYSKSRCEKAVRALTNAGVPAASITSNYYGDTVQPFAENDKNRVSIIVASGLKDVGQKKTVKKFKTQEVRYRVK